MATRTQVMEQRSTFIGPSDGQDSIGAATGAKLGKIRGFECWEAVGIVGEQLKELVGKIKDYLQQYSDPVPAEVIFAGYMIGLQKRFLRPTVLFCSAFKKSRTTVREIIKQSKLVHAYPGFKTSDYTHPPDFPGLRPLASACLFTHFDKLSLTPLELDRFPGASLMALHLSSGIHSHATAGGLLVIERKSFYLTAAHVFTDVPGFQAWDETTDNYNDVSIDDSDVEWEDLSLFTASNTEGSRTTESMPSSPQRDISKGKNRALAPEGSSITDTCSFCSTDASDQRIGVLLSTTGSQPGLDYALVPQISPSDKDDLINTICLDPRTPEERRLRIKAPSNASLEESDVFIASSGVILKGSIKTNTSFITGEGSNKVQELWKVHVSTFSLRNGDCGAWVFDQMTGELYGHVVAAGVSNDVINQMAYVIPASQIFDDISQRFGPVQLFEPSLEIKVEAIKTEVKIEDGDDGNTIHEALQRSHVEPFKLLPAAGPRLRVAIAGTNTLARMIAHYLVTETSHQVIMLSRRVSHH
jgi:hypothetical protein